MTLNLTIPPEYDVIIQDLLDDSPEERVRCRPHDLILEIYPTKCGTEFSRYTVGGRTYYRRHTGEKKPLHKRYCPVCARIDANKKALNAFHRLMAFEWDNMWGITLTTPEDFLEADRLNDAAYVLKRKNEFTRMCKQYMDQFHSGVPYQTYFHHWGTSNPLGTPQFHMHLTAPCATYSFEKEGGLIDRQLKKLVDLDVAKETWRKILGIDVVPVLHYQYISRRTRYWTDSTGKLQTRGGPRKIRHWLNYCYRSYIGDVEKLLMKTKKRPSQDELEWLSWHMRDKDAKIVITTRGTEFVQRNGSWGRRMGSHRQFANRNRSKYIKEDIVEKRIRQHVQIASELYTPDTRKRVRQQDKLEGAPVERLWMKRGSLLISKRVLYVDYPIKKFWYMVCLPVPYSCMRWKEYHEEKKHGQSSGKEPTILSTPPDGFGKGSIVRDPSIQLCADHIIARLYEVK